MKQHVSIPHSYFSTLIYPYINLLKDNVSIPHSYFSTTVFKPFLILIIHQIPHFVYIFPVNPFRSFLATFQYL